VKKNGAAIGRTRGNRGGKWSKVGPEIKVRAADKGVVGEKKGGGMGHNAAKPRGAGTRGKLSL